MIDKPLSLPAWTLYLDQAPLPVLRRTEIEMARLREKVDEINGHELSAVILRDPVMTVNVLRYLEAHRSTKQLTDVTTIDRAIMMIGTTPFFKRFSDQPLIEDALADYPLALDGMMRVISRSHHAALYAQDWSILRHDIDIEEVVVAALLRDLAEILLWCFAPEPMLQIREKMRLDPTLRSMTAQLQVLGFSLLELQLDIATTWHLPHLLLSLMNEYHAELPRTKCVVTATALARHSANGWNNPALPDDFKAIQELLGIPPEVAWERVRHATLKAAKDWDWYGVQPSASWLPMQSVIDRS